MCLGRCRATGRTSIDYWNKDRDRGKVRDKDEDEDRVKVRLCTGRRQH